MPSKMSKMKKIEKIEEIEPVPTPIEDYIEEKTFDDLEFTTDEQISMILSAVRQLLEKDMTEEELLEHIELYPKWEVGLEVSIKEPYYKYNDKLYKLKPGMDHITQENWNPERGISQWSRVVPENIIPEWKVENAQDYKMGDKVTNNGKIFELIVLQYAAFEPHMYPQGWEEIT